MGMLITSPATRINTLRPRQMATVLQNAFCMFSKKNACIFIEISQKFVSNGYIANKAAQLPIRQHWFRSWFGAVQVPSHYMSQCLASLRQNGLTSEPSYICQSVGLSSWRISLDLATSESGQFTAICSLRDPISFREIWGTDWGEGASKNSLVLSVSIEMRFITYLL